MSEHRRRLFTGVFVALALAVPTSHESPQTSAPGDPLQPLESLAAQKSPVAC